MAQQRVPPTHCRLLKYSLETIPMGSIYYSLLCYFRRSHTRRARHQGCLRPFSEWAAMPRTGPPLDPSRGLCLAILFLVIFIFIFILLFRICRLLSTPSSREASGPGPFSLKRTRHIRVGLHNTIRAPLFSSSTSSTSTSISTSSSLQCPHRNPTPISPHSHVIT